MDSSDVQNPEKHYVLILPATEKPEIPAWFVGFLENRTSEETSDGTKLFNEEVSGSDFYESDQKITIDTSSTFALANSLLPVEVIGELAQSKKVK